MNEKLKRKLRICKELTGFFSVRPILYDENNDIDVIFEPLILENLSIYEIKDYSMNLEDSFKNKIVNISDFQDKLLTFETKTVDVFEDLNQNIKEEALKNLQQFKETVFSDTSVAEEKKLINKELIEQEKWFNDNLKWDL